MIRALARDTLTYGAALAVGRIATVALLPLYTRLLAEGEIGALDLIGIGAAFVNVTVALEVAQGLARLLPATTEPRERAEYAATAFWFTVACYAMFAVLALVAAPLLSQAFLGGAYLAELRIGILSAAVGGVFLYVTNQLRYQLQASRYAVSLLVATIAAITLAVVFVAGLRYGLAGVLLAQLIGGSVGLGVGLLLARPEASGGFSMSKLREMLAFSLPLVPSSVSVILMLSIDRLLINSLLRLDDVGIYGVAYRIGTSVGLLMAGIQLALTPHIYAKYKDSETSRDLARIFRVFCALALIGVLALFLFGTYLVEILATSRYLAAAPLVPVIGAAILLSGMYLFAPGLALAKRTATTAALNIAGAILNVLLCLLLIPAWGILGAAAATLSASALLFAANMWISQRLYPVPHDWVRLAVGVAVCLVSAFVGALLTPMDTAGLTWRLLVIVAAGAALVRLRLIEPEELKSAVRALRALGGS